MWLSALRKLLRLSSSRRTTTRRPARRHTSHELILGQLEDRVMPSVVVSTDKIGYAPGEPAKITGSDFQEGETINLSVVNLTTGASYTPFTVTDGGVGDRDGAADGKFTTSWVLPDDSPGTTFELTAAG